MVLQRQEYLAVLNNVIVEFEGTDLNAILELSPESFGGEETLADCCKLRMRPGLELWLCSMNRTSPCPCDCFYEDP